MRTVEGGRGGEDCRDEGYEHSRMQGLGTAYLCGGNDGCGDGSDEGGGRCDGGGGGDGSGSYGSGSYDDNIKILDV